MRRRWHVASLLIFGLVAVSLLPTPARAAVIPSGDFSLEVSPSPLVATVTPGHPARVELKVHNAGSQPEELRIQARGFSIAHPSEQITMTTTTPPDLAQWVSFAQPVFRISPGAWYTQAITIALPESAGFSYPFALVITRAQDPTGDSTAKLRGSIAVFALVNIDKPGATRQLELTSFTTDRGIYEYLPTTFEINLKNTGNSIVQPYGNVFVQRDSQTATPLAVLPVNEARGYLLPGSVKQTSAVWTNGFPAYAATAPDKPDRALTWDWQNIAHFRFGRYTAKLVAVYNDGTRDVPVVSQVSFWVIPWRIMLGALVVLIILGFGLWSILKRVSRHTKRLVIRRRPQSPREL